MARMLRRHELGSPPMVIEPTATWTDHSDDAAAWAEFTRAGLTRRPGRLTTDAHTALAVLGQASVRYFGWLATEPGHTGGLLVAAHGQDAVYVVRSRNQLKLESIPATGLVEAFVARLRGAAPARIDAVNIRTRDLRPRDDALLQQALPVGARDVAVVQGLLARPVTGLGELYAATRDRVGTRPVWYRDTKAGRIMIVLSDEHISIAPGTNAVLVERLRRAYHEIAG